MHLNFYKLGQNIQNLPTDKNALFIIYTIIAMTVT